MPEASGSLLPVEKAERRAAFARADDAMPSSEARRASRENENAEETRQATGERSRHD